MRIKYTYYKFLITYSGTWYEYSKLRSEPFGINIKVSKETTCYMQDYNIIYTPYVLSLSNLTILYRHKQNYGNF